MFVGDNWQFSRIGIHDLDLTSATAFVAHAKTKTDSMVSINDGLDETLTADIVVFATTASGPYVLPPLVFRPGQLILNISLRDIAPELIVDAWNIFDDVDHCMKANTSPHLAEQRTGGRSFVTGTLAALIRGEIKVDNSRPLIYSPFGMGILDLALGKVVYDEACVRGKAISVPNFFGETSRW